MLRDYGAGEDSTTKDLCAQAMVAIIFFFSARQGMKTFFSQAKAFSGLCLMQMGGLQRCVSQPGLSRAGSGSRQKKKTVPEPKVAMQVTRLDPTVDTWQGGNRGRLESRAEVVVVVT
jgi:hypothetical protein